MLGQLAAGHALRLAHSSCAPGTRRACHASSHSAVATVRLPTLPQHEFPHSMTC
jgi:hypothetical protein